MFFAAAIAFIGYAALLSTTPIIIRKITSISPFEITRSYFNIQPINDIVHVCILTAMVTSGHPTIVKLLPQTTIIYFCIDILFHCKIFINNKGYLLHHIATGVNVMLFHWQDTDILYTLSILFYIQELALIPINIIDILRMQNKVVPKYMLLFRTSFYFLTRICTYGYVVNNFWFCLTKPVLFLMTPLLTHNLYILKKQIQVCMKNM
tara:strand:+ start:2269 stop:2889 length:621 start_codon:yes stop_codon:yes gene_type:complete